MGSQVSWSITYLNAPHDWPVLAVVTDALSGGVVAINRTVPGNGIAGTFTVKYGSKASAPLPYNASAKAVADAIRSLPTFRDPDSGEHGCHSLLINRN